MNNLRDYYRQLSNECKEKAKKVDWLYIHNWPTRQQRKGKPVAIGYPKNLPYIKEKDINYE